MKVLVADTPYRAQLGPLPGGVELVSEPEPDVEFAVISPDLAPRLLELLAKLPGLKVLQSTQAGVDWLLPHVPAGVTVCSATGALDISVAEWVVMTLLALVRRLPVFLEFQREGHWDPELKARSFIPGLGPPIEDLDGATVLIVGYGSIGRAVEARLRPFGAKVVGVARRPREGVYTPDALPELLPRASAVVLLLPLTDETRRIVDARFLSQLKPGAILINAGRGGVVDPDALMAELQARRIYAGLDVTDPEPLPDGHPLWSAPNLIITPHIAGATAHWLERSYRLAGDQLRRYAAGQPLINVQN